MLFNSAVFILLFFIFYVAYWNVSVRWKHTLIIVASFLFYAWFSITFFILFLFLIIVNYRVSGRIIALRKQGGEPALKRAKHLMIGAVVLDIGVLAFFKYFYLFAESAGVLFGSEYIAHLRHNWKTDYDLVIILPLAISFYTFQIVAWVVDAYRGTIEEDVPFKSFCVFILFFPQFVAGPIMRASDFIPQLDNPIATRDRMLNGSLLILQGVLKKVLIADRLGALTADAWVNPEKYDAVILILILPAFAAQIYCDFSGYTDMARGLAKLLGYEIPENFNGPYLSRSVSELWNRWHVTLSTWLRDYIFIPLGGSRGSEGRVAFNLMVTMGLAGLWHGANWTMFLWGLYMGGLVIIERAMRLREIRILPETAWANVVRVLYVMTAFSASAIFFRAPSIEHTGRILSGIFNWQRAGTLASPEALILLSITAFLFNFPQFSQEMRIKWGSSPRLRYVAIPVGTLVIGFLVNLYGDVSGNFIYFVF